MKLSDIQSGDDGTVVVVMNAGIFRTLPLPATFNAESIHYYDKQGTKSIIKERYPGDHEFISNIINYEVARRLKVEMVRIAMEM